MDRNDTPRSLDTELLEKGSRDNGRVADESIGIEQGAANDATSDDADSTANRLTAETDDSATKHSSQVSDNLGDSDLVLGKVELVLQHGRVQVLATVAHEVEARHEKDKIYQQKPVVLESDFAFFDENLSFSVCASNFSCALAFLVRLCLGEHQTSDDEEDRGASAEPEERTPVVGGCIDETASKCGTEKVPESILQQLDYERQ